VKKERARQDEDKQWEQARAPLYLLQGEIQGLQTQIQQVERDTMDQLKTHINLMTIQMQRQLDNSYEQQAQTNVLIQTLYQKIEDLENQLQQVKEENTKPKTEEAQPKSESVSVMKRVA
jgi:chromosome segregation ATPase